MVSPFKSISAPSDAPTAPVSNPSVEMMSPIAGALTKAPAL